MKRLMVLVTVWTMGLAGVLTSVVFSAGSASAAVTAPGGYTSLAPARLLDTRSAVGVTTTTPVAAGGTVALQVLGRGGVPASGVSAVVLNVTVAGPTASGYVTVYGDGTTRPTASNLNYVRGQMVPNLVVAPVGANGKVAMFNGSPGTTHLIADVSGYFLAGTPSTGGAFQSLAPSRLLDTRIGVGAPTGAVAPGGTVSLQVIGRGGIPPMGSVPSAVVLNVTTAAPTASGYVTVYGDGTTRPTASNLNYVRGQMVPNLVVAPVGANGKVALYNGSAGTVQLIADVSGYFLPGTPTAAGALRALAPTRLLDTRSGLGAPQAAVPAGGTLSLLVAGRGGVPASGASAVVLNVTAAAPTASGYVTVYGDGTNRPTASNLNYVRGQVVPNLVIAPVGANGRVAMFNGSPGTVQLIADVSGWFPNAPTAATGAISGTVTDAGGTHHGLANVGVQVSSPSTGSGGHAMTAANGTYTVTDLPTATDYQVCFDPVDATGGVTDATGYVQQCWQNQPDWDTATPVTVTAPATRSGINAALVGGGAVSGTVTDAGGTHHGLANVQVNVWSESANSNGGGATTNANGTYTVKGLPAGTDYQVCFWAADATGGSADALGYADQCYNNQPPMGTPTPVIVTAGATRTAINAALASGGAISGTVTDAGGTHHGLAGVRVDVNSPSTGAASQAWTAADGTYTVKGIPAGTDYRVCFYANRMGGATGGSSDALGYVDQCYNNQPASGTPTPVTVTAGSTRTAINAALAAGGAISGTVTDAGGTHHGLESVWVNVSSPSTGENWDTQTDALGTYTVIGLPARTDYRVCFSAGGATGGSSDALGYVNQCYNNQPESGTPTPVTVTVGATRTGVNAALAAGGAISGTVTDAGGTHHGLANVWVDVYSPSTGSGVGVPTAADGTYTVTGLRPGTDYQVCFRASGATGGSSDTPGYIDQCYNNQPASGTPTPVTVTAGATRTGINAALAAGGAISGTVTDAGGTHQGLENVWVNVYSPSTGNSWGASTSANGNYAVTVPPGTDYQVCFDANGAMGGSSSTGYIGECYNNQPPSGTPTPVTVTAGTTTTGINAALAAGGAISGRVTDAAGTHHGLANVGVNVYSPSTGNGYGTGTDQDGNYTVTVPPGTDYQVCFTASGATGGSADAFGYIDQCYNNQPASGTPTPVTVTTGATRTGVNAALAAGGAVTGTVTDAGGTHHALENVWVWMWSESTGAGNGARTAANGTYTVTGLPSGTDYRACFYASGATGGSADTPGYLDQCYNNQPLSGTPTPVTVTVGTTRTGINAALAGGGAISGTVTDAGDTQALSNVNVWVQSLSTGNGYGTSTEPNGNYSLVVPPGTDYQVCFNAPGYVDQCYNNQPPSTPTSVVVTLGGTRTGVNAALVASGGTLSRTTPPGAGGTLSRTTPGAKGTVSPMAPGAGDASHWLAVHRRAEAQGFSRPLALIRLGTVLSPYRLGFRAVAQSQQSQLRRDALARHSSPGPSRSGLTRSLIGSR